MLTNLYISPCTMEAAREWDGFDFVIKTNQRHKASCKRMGIMES